MQSAKNATPENLQITSDVIEIADAWRRGELPLAGVRTACHGYDRFVAMNHAREAVKDLIEALAAEDDAREGIVRTRFGGFTPQDLREHGGIHTSANGRDRLLWPVSGRGPGSWRYAPTEGRE